MDPYKLRSKVTSGGGAVITTEEFKDHHRISFATEDDYIDDLVVAATSAAEDFMGRRLITATIEGFLDSVPGDHDDWWDGIRQGSITELGRGAARMIELLWVPLISVTSISTFDDEHNETTFDSSNYYVDTGDDDRFGRIILNRSSIWPTDLRLSNAIKVVYTAGYGTISDVPNVLKHAVKVLASHMYENRGDCAEKCICDSGAVHTLRQYRVLKL